MTWLWILGCVVVGIGAVLVGSAKARRRIVRSARRRWKSSRPRPARTARRAPARAPLTGHNQRAGRRPVMRATRCSAACRTSRKPAYDSKGRLTCDCPCKGDQHGRYRPGTNAALRHGSMSKPRPAAPAPVPRPAVTRPPQPKPAVVAAPRATAPAEGEDRNQCHSGACTDHATHEEYESSGFGRRYPTRLCDKHAEEERQFGRTVHRREPVHSQTADRGWKSLRPDGREAMSRHAKDSPRCIGGTASARTFRDNRTDPPTVTQTVSCDTCKKDLT